MADQDLLHTAEIMKAALPFIDSRSRVMAEFFTKILDLMGSLNAMTKSNNMAACGYDHKDFDIEGLLNGIRPLCSGKERVIVDRILSIFNMKRMFEMYNNFMSTMKTMQEFGGFPFGDSGNGNDADNIMGNFKDFNFDSIFGNAGNKSSTEAETEAKVEGDAETDFYAEKDFNTESDSVFQSFDAQDIPDENKYASSNTEQATNTSSTGNNPMFEMLKAMVPPEQLSTFQNLSMLFNTMSYDSNSKPDDNKEQNNG